MERRNFLGLAALMGLAPILAKIPIEEHIGIKTVTVNGVPVEIEPMTLPEEIKISILPDVKIKVSEKRFIEITGNGKIENQVVSFCSKGKIGEIQSIEIDGNPYGRVLSISQSGPAYNEFIDEETAFTHHQLYEPVEIFLICQKS